MLEPDPHLPARIRAIAQEAPARAGARGRARLRWAWASLAAAALVFAAGVGAYVGYRAGTASRSLTDQQTTDADLFLAALSQSGFGENLSQLGSANNEVNE
jgi:hypothetical protein